MSRTSIAKKTVRYSGVLVEEDFRKGRLWEETIESLIVSRRYWEFGRWWLSVRI